MSEDIGKSGVNKLEAEIRKSNDERRGCFHQSLWQLIGVFSIFL